MSLGFNQHFLGVVGPDVVPFVETIHFPSSVNKTHIVLILKSIGDLRHIALCNDLYRIAEKVLANRLKEFLGNIVSDA